MSVLTQLPRLFLEGPKKYCTKCSKPKPMNDFAHGKEYVNKYCRECEGKPMHEDMPTGTLKVPHTYMLTLSTFLPKSRLTAERFLKMARFNTYMLTEVPCQRCGSEADELAYAYEDKTAIKPFSIFASNSKFKNAYFFCDSCAREMYSKRPKRGGKRRTSSKTRKLILADKDTPQKERDTSAKNNDDNQETYDNLKDGQRQCNTCSTYFPLEEFHKRLTPLAAARGRTAAMHYDCKGCRREKARAYTKKYSKYVKDIKNPKYNKIRDYVTTDFRFNPCSECGIFHSENNPLKYYDPETLEVLPTETEPYMNPKNLRLHASCLRSVKKFRLL